ncbi:MAG: hypothetical protein ABI700_21225 [Chloroflexota bacterium]
MASTPLNQHSDRSPVVISIEVNDQLPANTDELIDPTEGFKRGWAQAMCGEVLTEDEFWKAVTEDK